MELVHELFPFIPIPFAVESSQKREQGKGDRYEEEIGIINNRRESVNGIQHVEDTKLKAAGSQGKKVSTLQPPLNMDLLTAAVTLTVLR